MDAQTALQVFLAGTLGRKRDRYLGFIAEPKTRPKFLRAIYHELEGDLDASRRIKSLPTGGSPIDDVVLGVVMDPYGRIEFPALGRNTRMPGDDFKRWRRSFS